MSDQQYTISALAELAHVTRRTIRYYTSEGLLAPPDARGKFALYSEDHLLRLRVIAALKATYLPLGEIKARIESLGTEELRQLLAGDAPPSASAPPVAEPPVAESIVEPPAAPTPKSGGLFSRLVTRRREQPSTPSAPSAAGESWQRVTLAPGVELHLREPLPPDLRARVERLLAQARELLG